jgi:hypothetical protein
LHNWKELVRVRLTPLPLEATRREEIIEELAQQLEEAYREAVAGGASDSEALHRSFTQFKDWEDLRRDVFHAVKAEALPVWQQNGILSPRRPVVWIALILSLALFGLFGFRQALGTLSVAFAKDPWADRLLSARSLSKIERQALTQGDSRVLAFVALHHPDINEAAGAAEKAIALDERLTWISARFAQAHPPEFDPAPWITRLKRWDPDNAFPYLLEADQAFHPRSFAGAWERRGAVLAPPRAIAVESDFRLLMEKAFAAPRYDSYGAQRFELDHAVLQQLGWDRPRLLMIAVQSQPIPNLQAIRTYAGYLVVDLGESAEKAGRTQEAFAEYQAAAQFGGRMLEVTSLIERRIGMAIRQQAYEHLVPLLLQQGRTAEAALLEASLTDVRDTFAAKAAERNWGELAAERAASLVLFSGVLVVVLGLPAAAWLLAVVVLRWRDSASRLLNGFASVAGLAPPALLLSGLWFYSAYYPFVRHIKQFESAEQLMRDLLPFWDSLTWMNGGFGLHMLIWPAVSCAVVATLGAITLHWVATRRQDTAPHEE